MFLFFLILLALPVTLAFLPQADIAVSGLFYAPGLGFPLAQHPFFVAVHDAAVYGGRTLGVFFLLCFIIAALTKKNILRLDKKAWAFLFLTLAIGLGLITNVILKDNWGRARPNTITEFAGTAQFTPAFVPAHECVRNCSFVAGDGAFGFFLPCLAFVVARKRRRYVFWAGMAAGELFGLDRIAMGAHFLSDVGAAAFVMLLTGTVLHTILYGRAAVLSFWKDILSFKRLEID